MSDMAMGLPKGTVLQSMYVIEEELGTGGFGKTYKAHDRLNDKDCAIKEFLPNRVAIRVADNKVLPIAEDKREEFEHGRLRFIEEADKLRKLHGYRNIVNITDYFDENNTSYFVMEFIDGVNLNRLCQSYGGRIPFKECMEILYPICVVLDGLHTREGLFHRDISPENIMIDRKNVVRLIDFGNARDIGRRKGHTVVLKQGFAPLEQYSSKGEQGGFTDVYALAITFYYLLTGVMLPPAPDRLSDDRYTPLSQIVPEIPAQVSNAFDRALKVKAPERTQTIREFMNQIFDNSGSVRGSGPSAAPPPQTPPAQQAPPPQGQTPPAQQAPPPQRQTPPAQPARTPQNAKPYIEVVDGIGKGKIYSLPPNKTVTMGRSKIKADICLCDDLHMSKVHCQIFYDSTNSCFYVEDCSTNGIYRNDMPFKKKEVEVVRQGEVMVFGNHICEIKVGVKHE